MAIPPTSDLLDPLLLGNLAEQGPVVLLAPTAGVRDRGVVLPGAYAPVALPLEGHIAAATSPAGDRVTRPEAAGDRLEDALVLFLPGDFDARSSSPVTQDSGHIVQWRGSSYRVISSAREGGRERDMLSLTALRIRERDLPAGLPLPPA